jgi:hypothetical protein
MTTDTLDPATEAALRDALSRVALAHGAPDAAAARVIAHPYRTRSTRPVLAAGLAGAAALSGVGVLATGGRAGHAPAGPRPPVHLTNAQLTAEITNAVDDTTGDIFEVHTTGGGVDGSATHWLSADGNTMRVASYAPDGTVTEDASYVDHDGQQTITDVDETTKTWWTITVPGPPGPPATCVAPSCLDQANGGLPPGGMLDGSPTSAAGVAWLLSTGGFAKTGQTKTVDGVVGAYQIASASVPVSNAVFFPDFSMWIDPGTNLPVQVTMGTSGGPQSLNAEPQQPPAITAGTSPITSDVTWLDPSVAANAAQLTTTVPAGYTQVAAPPGPYIYGPTGN